MHSGSCHMYIESCHRHMHINSLLLPSCHDGDASFLLPSMICEKDIIHLCLEFIVVLCVFAHDIMSTCIQNVDMHTGC